MDGAEIATWAIVMLAVVAGALALMEFFKRPKG